MIYKWDAKSASGYGSSARPAAVVTTFGSSSQ